MLTLIVPGLLWPRQALVDLTGDLVDPHHPALPAFTTLLGRGRIARAAAGSPHDWLARLLGLPTPLPAAALRGLAMGDVSLDHKVNDNASDNVNASAAGQRWLCLDPLHLRLDQLRAIVDPPRLTDLHMAEAEQLAVSLAPTFSAFGELRVLAPHAWQLRLQPGVDAPPTVPLPDLIARAAPTLPDGAAWAAWRRALTEAQMILHAHPVNQTREAAGQPVINSLWPWGAGALPTPNTPITPSASASSVGDTLLWSDDSLAQGAARLLGLATAPAPARYAPPNKAAALILFDGLDYPARSADTHTWRERLLALENDWLAPALAALRRGQIVELRLLAPGDTLSFEIRLRRADDWKFWRRPAPLTAIALP